MLVEFEDLGELEELDEFEGKPGTLGELEDEELGILGMLLELEDVDELGMLGILLELEELEDELGILGMLELEELWLDDSQATNTVLRPTSSRPLAQMGRCESLPELLPAYALTCLCLAVYIGSL